VKHQTKKPRLHIKPLTIAQANELISKWHRHHKRVQGHRFSLGVYDEYGICHGAAVIGRPVARKVPAYEVAEVTRLVTDGTYNTCSCLYAAAARAAQAMGFSKIQTYILESESGISLKASGWTCDGSAGGGQWKHTDGKYRRTDQPTGLKVRYSKILNTVQIKKTHMRVSHTQLSMFQECPAKYRHYYLRKMRQVKRPTYFILGSAVHAFIEKYYTTRDEALARRAVDTEFGKVDRALLNAEEVHSLEVDRQIALGICEAYPGFYAQDFDQYQKFICEQQFSIKLGDHEYMGFIDVMVQDAAGDWWIMETKTASAQALNADYFERVQIDSQVTGYMYGAKEILGSFPRGVIYNVIKKPSIRLKSGETHQAFQRRVFQEYKQFGKEKAYFTRQELMIGKIQLTRWLKNTKHCTDWLSSLVVQRSKVWPMHTGACTSKYGTCPWLNACVTGAYNRMLYRKEE